MEKVKIQTPDKEYPVYIGDTVLDELRTYFEKSHFSKVMIITDETVAKLHLNHFLTALSLNQQPVVYTAPSGEKAKTFPVYEKCLSFAIENGLDRKSCILALGGGAVGDLSGFVASTYMRGIPYIQIPTTILAHDSAVGGKVAINHPLGKNMVGSFYHPEMVVYFTPYLNSLPFRQLRSGFAEVIKEALIADSLFYTQLLEEVSDLASMKDLPAYLKKGMEIKAEIVGKDEKETGIRAYLNFGHTLGHALEADGAFQTLFHGEAVMTGIVFALKISMLQLKLAFPFEEFIHWIEKLGYDWKIPQDADFDNIFNLMKRDKKAIRQKPMFILLKEIGKPVVCEVEEELLRKIFYSLK